MVGQTVCHPICERPVLPQTNTCTDLMTVFFGGHVAAKKCICMRVLLE